MNNLFDIACNFSSDRFEKDLNEVIKRAQANNVTKFLLVSASLKDAEKVNKIYQNNDSFCEEIINFDQSFEKKFT